MQMVDFCLEPKTWQVEEEAQQEGSDAVRQHEAHDAPDATLDGISGKLEGGGGITFTEEDGIDYAPTTVQPPGGERVPFLYDQGARRQGLGGAFAGLRTGSSRCRRTGRACSSTPRAAA